MALAFLSALWLLASASPAFAHARLVEASPGDGETLSKPPRQVELRFNEPVEAEFAPIEVYDDANERVDRDDGRVDPQDARVVLVDLRELSGGSYTVDWRVTSVDGHVINGAYAFKVNPAEATADGRDSDTTAAAEPEVDRRTGQERDPAQGTAWVALLGVLAVGALTAGGFVVLRRWGS
jgi:methionine-rich copper-binding protein CopC